MLHSFAPLGSLPFTPDLSYQDLEKHIATSIEKLKSHRGVLCLPAQNDLSTICQLFAAWRLHRTVFLISPRLPPKEWKFPQDLPGPRLLLLTSGSSGEPKLASFSLEALLNSAQAVSRRLDAKFKDLWSLNLPLSHVGGLGVLLRTVLSSGTLLLEKTPSPQANFASLVPTQLYRLLQNENFTSSTTYLIGGAPLSKGLYERAKKQGLKLFLTYGLTEMSSTILLSDDPTWQGETAYLGFPLPGREMKLFDQEIFVRGQSLFQGYGLPPTPPPDWFATKDLGHLDPEKGFAILGRKDFQFISGGENIHPEEIEAALLSHPLVEQALIVPTQDPEFGQRPLAFIQTSATPKSLSEYLLNLLPKYKIPVKYLPFPEEFGSLKPSRRALIAYVSKNLD